MLDANPGMAGLLQDEDNSLLFASEVTPSNPELGPGNIGITRYPSSEPAEGEFQRGIVAAAELLKTTEGFTIRNVALDIEVAGYPAALTTYILELNIPNAGTFFVEGRQYYLQTSEHVWVLTYTFPQSRTEELLSLIEQSASSLEVKAEE